MEKDEQEDKGKATLPLKNCKEKYYIICFLLQISIWIPSIILYSMLWCGRLVLVCVVCKHKHSPKKESFQFISMFKSEDNSINLVLGRGLRWQWNLGILLIFVLSKRKMRGEFLLPLSTHIFGVHTPSRAKEQSTLGLWGYIEKIGSIEG